MYYLGIDGGGTKTAFEIIDEAGNILAKVKAGTCNYIQVGKDRFGEVIRDGVGRICKQLNIAVSDIGGSCVGIPSFGEISADTTDLIHIVESILQTEHVQCVNDVVVAWAGSLACNPGVNLLAGTGSMAYGRDRNNHETRVGGWGFFCGDEGSAYWLGKKLIELFTKQADGRMEKSRSYDIVRKEFQIENDSELISVIYNKLKFRREEIAGLQLLLNRATVEGDRYGRAIYRQAAYELSLQVLAAIRKLNFADDEDIAVSYSGGVFKAGALILEPLKEYLGKCPYRIDLKKPLLSPVTGAALFARNSFGKNRDETVIRNLLKWERNDRTKADAPTP